MSNVYTPKFFSKKGATCSDKCQAPRGCIAIRSSWRLRFWFETWAMKKTLVVYPLFSGVQYHINRNPYETASFSKCFFQIIVALRKWSLRNRWRWHSVTGTQPLVGQLSQFGNLKWNKELCNWSNILKGKPALKGRSLQSHDCFRGASTTYYCTTFAGFAWVCCMSLLGV